MHRFIPLLLILCSVALVGCRSSQNIKDAWKGTRSYYYEYLNTPASLNMDDKGNILDYQAEMGSAIADFDMRILELERVLQNSDRNPDAAWVTSLTARFPWLSAVALTDEEGYPRALVPPTFAKGFEIGTLLEVDPKQQIKDLRAFVQEDPQGPEIYVGNPVYIGADFKGVITVHFDPRALLARAGDPGKIIIAAPCGIVWPGLYDAQATPVAKVDWGEEVRKNSSGIVRNELGAFYWVCRYLGNLPLIYAVRVEGSFPLREENMQGLAQANAFAMGPINFTNMQPPANYEPPVEITPDGHNSPLAGPAPTQEGGSGTPLAQ